MFQMLACPLAVNVFALPIFAFIVIVPACQMAYTFYKGFQNPVSIIEFDQNGKVQKIGFKSAMHIF